jgi:hypothetical protein
MEMEIDPSGGAVPSIVERAKAIILRPKTEWPIIEREPSSSGEIFTRYAIPLAAIGPLAQFIGGQVFGYGAFGISYRPSLMSGLSMAMSGFVLSLVGLFIITFIADKLAGKFGGVSNSRNAFKLVAYSMTASWVVGIFQLVPSLGFLAILGFYSFYLFYVGAAPLMKVPADKALTYTIVTVLAAILLYFIIAAITASVAAMFGGFGSGAGGTFSDSGSESSGSMTIPGVGTIDTEKLEEASREIEAAQNREAVAAASLQALLPASIGGYERTAISSSKVGPTSQAEGTYSAGEKQFNLKVSDMAAMGAIAGMAGALGVESNREDGDSYERTNTIDGNLVIEKWDRSAGSGSYTTIVGKRFMIEAEGPAASVDELKAAVTSIDPAKLAGLAGS